MADRAHSTPSPLPAKPSRRGLMLATARLLALGGTVGAVAALSPDNPDARLIAMCERIVATHKEIEGLESPYYDEPSAPAHVQMRSSVLTIEGHRLAEAVAEMGAATPEGMRALARAMMSYACLTADGTPDWGNHSELLGWSIARNLLRGAEAAPAVPAAAAPAAVPTVAPDADAELIRLVNQAVAACRRHCEILPRDVVHVPPEIDAEAARLSAMAQDFCVRAADMPASTLAGHRAKAKTVALTNSANMGCADTDPAFYALRSLLDDLMGGEGAVEAFYDRVYEGVGAV